MKIINAFASCITPHLVRAAIIGASSEVKTVRMHPAQVCAIAMLYEAVAVESVLELKSLEEIDAVRHLAKEYKPATFLGMEIDQDTSMSKSDISFQDANGDVVAVIRNLSIPNGFQDVE